jgi:hypothetical protein
MSRRRTALPTPALRARLRRHLGPPAEPPTEPVAVVELNGYLLLIDHAKGRLMIAFPDIGLDTPVWLPAAEVRCDLAQRYGWAYFAMSAALAERRQKLIARELFYRRAEKARERQAKQAGAKEARPNQRGTATHTAKQRQMSPADDPQLELFEETR